MRILSGHVHFSSACTYVFKHSYKCIYYIRCSCTYIYHLTFLYRSIWTVHAHTFSDCHIHAHVWSAMDISYKFFTYCRDLKCSLHVRILSICMCVYWVFQVSMHAYWVIEICRRVYWIFQMIIYVYWVKEVYIRVYGIFQMILHVNLVLEVSLLLN